MGNGDDEEFLRIDFRAGLREELGDITDSVAHDYLLLPRGFNGTALVLNLFRPILFCQDHMMPLRYEYCYQKKSEVLRVARSYSSEAVVHPILFDIRGRAIAILDESKCDFDVFPECQFGWGVFIPRLR